MKTKVLNVISGEFTVDSIIVELDNKTVEICFEKADNVTQYNGKEIELIEKNGIYTIKEIKSVK